MKQSRRGYSMGDGDFISGLVIGFLLGIITVLWFHNPTTEADAYKQGQIDCMSGDIKYERVVKQDTTYRRME